MRKVISLSEKAHGTHKKLKRKNESYSDVVLRIADKKEKKSILEFAGTWKGGDADKIFSVVAKDRERSLARKIHSPFNGPSKNETISSLKVHATKLKSLGIQSSKKGRA